MGKGKSQLVIGSNRNIVSVVLTDALIARLNPVFLKNGWTVSQGLRFLLSAGLDSVETNPQVASQYNAALSELLPTVKSILFDAMEEARQIVDQRIAELDK